MLNFPEWKKNKSEYDISQESYHKFCSENIYPLKPKFTCTWIFYVSLTTKQCSFIIFLTEKLYIRKTYVKVHVNTSLRKWLRQKCFLRIFSIRQIIRVKSQIQYDAPSDRLDLVVRIIPTTDKTFFTAANKIV